MQGLISLADVIAALPKDQRERVEALGAELVAKIRERMTLAELRKRRKLSQATMAEALGIGQMQISRLEQRKDPRLSTMKRTVEAMGGSLTMIVTFPDQEPVVLVSPAPSEAKKATGNRDSAKGGKASRLQPIPRAKSREVRA